jgi:hypothetical protein
MPKARRMPASDALSRANLFGSPPIIEAEKAKDYRKLLERVFDAVEPADFIEEIWARDLADVTWSMFRLRRILAALLDNKVWDEVNDEASSRAEQEAKFLEGTEKEDKIPDSIGKNVSHNIRAPMTSSKHFGLKLSPA